jgi:protein SCO1/2
VSRRRRSLTVVVAALATLTAVTACGGGGGRELSGYSREPLPVVGDLSLSDATADSAPFSFRADPGGLLIVYFGYTNCPDYCPTTMNDVKLARARLDDPDKISVAMVTVDPDRDFVIDAKRCDDAIVLACYVRSFVPDAHALGTDDAAALSEVAAPFGVSYNIETSGDEIIVSHSTSLYAVDDQGNLVITWQFGIAIDDLAADLETLLDEQTA